ncbi:hypothetical protein [Bacillus horti]|uniref:DUF4179 domain-containing protein n=1 Tax=Caldalkalibacillus horti TaxID=77523 RepID=A0ABT9VVL8_9BACI|nr:hypothetical protein [Bacillus horti]MDQ0164999.1 hypothetical protein [Bacillus horti]
MKDKDLEQLLRQSLASAVEPEEKLNQSLIRQLKERSLMKNKYRRLSSALLAAALLLIVSVSAYAATQLFSAKQVAENLGDQLLASAFESKDAIQIEQSLASGDYHFTLHGLVSGAGLSEFPHSSERIYPDKSYVVVSITRQDGKPMPATSDLDYGQDPFFVSPLIKGQEPWRVNIITMNGAYSEIVIDGVMYRMIESDQIEIFADRGVYLAISSGSPFYSNDAFMYDEETGEIRASEDYSGASLLFDLPLDTSKADPEKAEAYLEELLNPSSSKESERDEHSSSFIESGEWVNWIEDIRDKILMGETIGETIAESINEVSYNDSGEITYTYNDWSTTANLENLFEEGHIGFTDRGLSISGNADDIYQVVLFHRDENGVITGRVVILDKGLNPQK